jgi:hypothetical protein
MSNKTTVETVSITDIKAGDTIFRDGGERTVVAEVTRCMPFLLRYRDTDGMERYLFSGYALRVVPEEPAEEEPVWPDVDFIRIIRGTENGDRIDGSLAHRIGSQRRFLLLDGPKFGSCVFLDFEGDAIFEWEEVVAVSKSAILTDLDTLTENEPEDDNTDYDAESEKESEDEEECDGSCLACILMRVLTMAAGKEDAA